MNRILLAATLLPVLALGSCIGDAKDTGGIRPGKGDDKELSLSVNIKQSSGIRTETRATVEAEEGEEALSSLYLMFFEPDAGGEECLFVDYLEIDVTNLVPNTRIDIDMSSHPMLGVSDPYHILAVANVGEGRYIDGDVDTWMQQWEGRTAIEVKQQAMAWVQGASDDANAIAPNKLLMAGTMNKAAEQFDLELELSRKMVRFDVYNDIEDEYDLVSAEIWNAYPANFIWGENNDFSNDMSRIVRLYGVDNTSNTTSGGRLGNIMGGLYCFENQVIAPEQNDHLTTCVIVGMRERATQEISYYRMNINPAESAQVLHENNVYRLTIHNAGAGYASAAEAYAAVECGMDFMINYWDMSDYGLIVQNGNSILSIPSKTINFDEDGGEQSFNIFTFNNGGATSGLTIKSQSYSPDDGSITTTLAGNKLTVDALPLVAGTERTGTIVVAYAGLEATINVVQNEGVETFLKLHQPAGGLRPLAPYAGIATGDIRVEASGPWTAELFMPDGGFTFDPDKVSPVLAVTRIQSSDPLVTDDRFKIYTWSANPNPARRDCFLVVTLDSAPENYAAVLQLDQSPAGGISVVPNRTSVTFNGKGDGLAAIAGNTTSTFNVRPSMEDDGSSGEQIAQWVVSKVASGAHDDTAMFTTSGENHSQTDASANTITAGAVGMNVSGRPYTAKLRLSLQADPSKFTEITLIQQSLDISLSPGILPALSADGGHTGAITVVADASLMWSADIQTVSGTSSDGRSLVNHAARLVDKNGNPLAAGQHPMSEQLYVEFPKVYYPNRDIPISATVTVTVEGLTSHITVNQTELTARKMVGYGMTGAPAYGGMGDTYNRGWDGESGSYGLAQVPGYSRLGVGNMNVGSIPPGVTYLHVTPHIGGASGDNYNWTVVNDFIDTRDAWTLIQTQDNYGSGPMNNTSSPTKKAGYNDVVYNVTPASWSHVYQGQATSKLYQYVMDKGYVALAPAGITADFYNDAVSMTIPQPWPDTAIVLMTKANNDNNASLIVDIEHKFIWLGESQIFWYDTYLSQGRGTFLANLMRFVANASMYGSNFTDLLLEPGRPGVQPAPWDSYWGANAEPKAKYGNQ